MAAFRMLFLVMFVALAAGPRAEAVDELVPGGVGGIIGGIGNLVNLLPPVALAADPRAEAVIGNLGTTVAGLVNVVGTVVCPANATIGIGTPRPASQGSLVQLQCRGLLSSLPTITATTNNLGEFSLSLNVTSTLRVTVGDILRDCSLVVSAPLASVCNIISATPGILVSTLTFLSNIINGVLGQVTLFGPTGFQLVIINV